MWHMDGTIDDEWNRLSTRMVLKSISHRIVNISHGRSFVCLNRKPTNSAKKFRHFYNFPIFCDIKIKELNKAIEPIEMEEFGKMLKNSITQHNCDSIAKSRHSLLVHWMSIEQSLNEHWAPSFNAELLFAYDISLKRCELFDDMVYWHTRASSKCSQRARCSHQMSIIQRMKVVSS